MNTENYMLLLGRTDERHAVHGERVAVPELRFIRWAAPLQAGRPPSEGRKGEGSSGASVPSPRSR
eukprot:6183707-Pleurochrysis_carterae.AAC.1